MAIEGGRRGGLLSAAAQIEPYRGACRGEAGERDAAGNVYVADEGNASIRKITPDGTTTTLLGGFEQRGIILGSNPRLGGPHAIVVDGATLIIADGAAVLRVVLAR